MTRESKIGIRYNITHQISWFWGILNVSFRRIVGAMAVAAALFALPAGARADCGVTESGIPDEAAFKIDPGGVRQGLAKAGIAVGGTYYGETFHNWGGFRRAASMTACSRSTSMPT